MRLDTLQKKIAAVSKAAQQAEGWNNTTHNEICNLLAVIEELDNKVIQQQEKTNKFLKNANSFGTTKAWDKLEERRDLLELLQTKLEGVLERFVKKIRQSETV